MSFMRPPPGGSGANDATKGPPVPPDKAPPPSFEESMRQHGSTTAVTASSSTSQPVFQTRFACMSLNKSDRVCFFNFGADDVNAMRALLQSAWIRGIQDVRRFGRGTEIKLHGRPWGMSTGKDESRKLMRRMLETLYDRGWVLQSSVDVSKSESDKDSLIFRHQNPPPPPCDWLTISFTGSDRLKIASPPAPEVCAALTQSLGTFVISRTEKTCYYFEIKFHGRPWHAHETEAITGRIILLQLLETLERFGYSLYASIDQKDSRDSREADELYMHRVKDWVSGMPVWHG